MSELNNPWKLDARLKVDTFFVFSTSECEFRLMNDKRWPWIILIPQVADAVELHDLSVPQQENVMRMASHIGEKLKAFTGASKINTAAIGNIVSQLHIHVVARREGDPNWPSPVWGFGEAEKYSGADGKALAEQLKEEFRVTFFS